MNQRTIHIVYDEIGDILAAAVVFLLLSGFRVNVSRGYPKNNMGEMIYIAPKDVIKLTPPPLAAVKSIIPSFFNDRGVIPGNYKFKHENKSRRGR